MMHVSIFLFTTCAAVYSSRMVALAPDMLSTCGTHLKYVLEEDPAKCESYLQNHYEDEAQLLYRYSCKYDKNTRSGDERVLSDPRWTRVMSFVVGETEGDHLIYTRRFIVAMFTRALREGLVSTEDVEDVFTDPILRKLFEDEDATVRWATGMLISEWRNFKDSGRYVIEVVKLLDTNPDALSLTCHLYSVSGRDGGTCSNDYEGEMSRMIRRLFHKDKHEKEYLVAGLSHELQKNVTVRLQDELLKYIRQASQAAKRAAERASFEDESDDDDPEECIDDPDDPSEDAAELHKLWLGFEAFKAFAYLPFTVLEEDADDSDQKNDALLLTKKIPQYVKTMVTGVCKTWSMKTRCNLKITLDCDRLRDVVESSAFIQEGYITEFRKVEKQKHQRLKQRQAEQEQRRAAEEAERIRLFLFVLVVLLCMGVIWLLNLRVQRIKKEERQPLWHYCGRHYGNLQWTSSGSFERAELPQSSALYGRIVQLAEDYGGQKISLV